MLFREDLVSGGCLRVRYLSHGSKPTYSRSYRQPNELSCDLRILLKNSPVSSTPRDLHGGPWAPCILAEGGDLRRSLLPGPKGRIYGNIIATVFLKPIKNKIDLPILLHCNIITMLLLTNKLRFGGQESSASNQKGVERETS